MARWSAGELARLVEAKCAGASDAAIDTTTTDSREAGPGAVFFALAGSRVRGVDYVPDAFGSGCSVVVVPSDWEGEIPPGRAALRVADPLEALGRLAAAVRARWSCPVIAVTGSMGKTTVKEMTACVLEGRGDVLRSPGNFNTVVGLARTLIEREPAPEIAVLEVGASRPGEIARLAGIVAPTGAALTNVAPAHLEGFGTVENVRREKMDLLRAVPPDGPKLIDGDDSALSTAAGTFGSRVVRIGLSPGNDRRGVDLEARPNGGTRFRVEGVPVELAVPGTHQVRNALFALTLGEEHGVPLEEGADRLREFAGVPGRLRLRRPGDVAIADDTYNANPASVAAALDWFDSFPTSGRRAVVLGDMLELGEESERYHREAGARVATSAFDLAVFVGPESRVAFEESRRRTGDREFVVHVCDSDEAARVLRDWVRPGDAVLVKGSRGMAMERVVDALDPPEALGGSEAEGAV